MRRGDAVAATTSTCFYTPGPHLGVGREVLGHVVAQVGGHDGRRRLAGAEAEVVARRRDRHAHEVAVLVDGADDGGHDRREGIITSSLGDLADVEQIDAVVRADGPVVVLAGPVDVVEGLLLEERSKSVLGRGLLDDLHDHKILIDLRRGRAEERRELVPARKFQ